MAEGGRFVFVVYEAGNFRLALDMSLALRATGAGVPVLFSPYFLPDTERYVEESAAHGIAYVYETTRHGGSADPFGQLAAHGFAAMGAPPPSTPLPRPSLRQALARWVMRAQRGRIAEWEAYYRSRIELARRFLHATNANAVILPEDNVERDSACWCAAVHETGGRATVISYGALNPLEAAIAYFDNPDFAVSTAADRAFAALYPRWSTRYKGRRLLRLPAARAIAMERLGLAPANPWIVNTGDVDAIAVESEFMKEQFARHSAAPGKVHATGHSSLDRLAGALERKDEVRELLRRDHGYDGTRRVLLCAMPPDQYPGVPAPEFASYDALVEAWLRALDVLREKYFAVVSPHPNIVAAVRARIAAAGFPVLEGGAARWLPACDLYVASVSGTIKWALACGKPVVNYDCYHYAHDDFRGIHGVAHADSYEGFRRELERFADGGYAAQRESEAREGRSRFGVLDGNSVHRVADLVRGRGPAAAQ